MHFKIKNFKTIVQLYYYDYYDDFQKLFLNHKKSNMQRG